MELIDYHIVVRLSQVLPMDRHDFSVVRFDKSFPGQVPTKRQASSAFTFFVILILRVSPGIGKSRRVYFMLNRRQRKKLKSSPGD